MEYLRMSVFPVHVQENTIDIQVYYLIMWVKQWEASEDLGAQQVKEDKVLPVSQTDTASKCCHFLKVWL